MSINRVAGVLRAAIADGLVPAGATAAAQDSRPWPVVLLTALGAWLAALPLLGVVGMLLGDLIQRSAGPYVVGMLVLAAALVVLRSRQVPLFVEQLAVPALLVGGGALAFGLYRDLPVQAASAMLCLVAIGVAMLIATPWLRLLLGALAALLLVLACLPRHWVWPGQLAWFWWAWHLCLALWLLAGWIQGRPHGGAPARWRLAAGVESVSAGWLLATLAGLAWWSGMTFLVGASMGSGLAGEVAREVGTRSMPGSQSMLLQALSLLLALAAALESARRWPSLRSLANAGIALVMAGLAWLMPALGGVLLVLALCVTSARWRLAGSAALAAAWIVGAFYYQLSWPLATKALLLVAAGVVLGGLAWFAARTQRGSDSPSGAPGPNASFISRAGIALSALAVLAVANIGIWQKEDLIAHGQAVFVELAPVDPRSLMQGDFMRLNFRIPDDARTLDDGVSDRRRPHVVARRDERGVATLLRIDEAMPVSPDELRFELTPKNGQWTLVTDAWFFKEGEAERWARAKYGEFRVDASGRALLVGLRDDKLEPL